MLKLFFNGVTFLKEKIVKNWTIPLLVSALSATSLSVNADNSNPKFLIGAGFSVGNATHELEGTGIGGSSKVDVDLDSYAGNIHFGFMLKNNNRFIISAESISLEDSSADEFEASGVRFDWQFVYTDNNVKPYFGVGFGLYSSEDLADLMNQAGLTTNESKINGISFQLMGGVKIAASEQIEIDLNIQSRAISWQDTELYAGSTKVATFEQSTSDVTIGMGIDFKF